MDHIRKGIKRIDLNTDIVSSCVHFRNPIGFVYELLKLSHKYGRITIWDFCYGYIEDGIVIYDYFEKEDVNAVLEWLSKFGLHLHMTKAELRKYQDCWDKQHRVEVKINNIDWEQRKWEATLQFALLRQGGISYGGAPYSESVLSLKESVEYADRLIEEYKSNIEK